MEQAPVEEIPEDVEISAEAETEDESGPPSPEAVEVEADAAESEGEPDPEPSKEPEEGWQRLEALMETGFESLRETLAKKLLYDRAKEEQIERLHAELQEHKKDLLARAVRPVLSGIIRIHGDLHRMVDGLRDKPPEELIPERFFRTLEGFADDLELLLEDHGVQKFEHPEPRFEPNRQTALETMETDDDEQVGHVAHRVRPGFAYGEILLQKERVVVYKAPRVDQDQGDATS